MIPISEINKLKNGLCANNTFTLIGEIWYWKNIPGVLWPSFAAPSVFCHLNVQSDTNETQVIK